MRGKPKTKMENYLFEDGMLPDGFSYPSEYIALIQTGLPKIDPWWWLAPYKDTAVSWSEILREQFPQYYCLVPFAKHGGCDDVACFDGSDSSGDPKVILIHSFCSPGWEYRGEYSFAEWLMQVKREAAEFEREAAEFERDEQE